MHEFSQYCFFLGGHINDRETFIMKEEAVSDFHVFVIGYKTRTQMKFAEVCKLFSEVK